ncbi:putative phage abortive infection protein [Maribacter sp. R77961]|uniref:putative phage abortive infection protein n=1 Tax=Maribacter sp. R77961 TaxID=3093871 RepID=UPI0037C75EDC
MSNSTLDTKINEYQNDISRISKGLGFIAVFLVIISFIAPWLFTLENISILDFSDKGAIGDTIGGIMNPFIGLAGVILTFLAFYLQYKANQIQIENFNAQLQQDREHFQNQINEQKKQFSKSQVESQFFEMIRLHKENVSEISLEVSSPLKKTKSIVTGRNAFEHLLNEVSLIHQVLKYHFVNEPLEDDYLIHLAYHYFFSGLSIGNLNHPPNKNTFRGAFKDLRIILMSSIGQSGVGSLKKDELYFNYDLNSINHSILQGYSHVLGHYYRHLFHTVKFIAQQDENFISYEEKRRYLRVLRAQLSNEEQALLFYNWKSNYGKNWESDSNKFLTDYRMIHNLKEKFLNFNFDLKHEFKIEKDKPIYYRTEKNRKDDFLFEFQNKELNHDS